MCRTWCPQRVSCPYCGSNLALTYSQKSQHRSQHPHKRANECTPHLQKRRVGRDVGGKEGKEKMLHGNAQWWVSKQISHRMYMTRHLYGRTSQTFHHIAVCRYDDWLYLQILFLNFHQSTKLSKGFLSFVCVGRCEMWLNVSVICVCVRELSRHYPVTKPETTNHPVCKQLLTHNNHLCLSYTSLV